MNKQNAPIFVAALLQNLSFMKKQLLFLLLVSFTTHAILAQEQDPPAFRIFSIYFGGGSYYIDEQQVGELYKFLDGIENIETHQISIHSHTDNIGSIQYNQHLSQMRSEAAFNKLLQRGIPSDIITIADFGELNPVYSNDTWDGKQRNRRVDVIIKPLNL
jgi:outer membrane protein OmpA-like peptidoglycan-associated protein